MKNLIYLFLIIPSILFAQKKIDAVWVKNFRLIKQVDNRTNEDLLEFESLTIKIIDSAQNEMAKITHKLKSIGGDSNSTDVEIGDVKIVGSQLVLYSFWCWQGDLPVSPWGVRKQVYNINDKGNIEIVNSSLYIVSGRANWPENKGVEFLYQNPKNQEDKITYLNYIKKMELEYNSKFVYGIESDELIIEVKDRFKSYLSSLEQNWSKLENSFGYKI